MMNGNDDNKTNDQAGSTPSASSSASSSPSASTSASSGLETQTIDAKALNLQGGATSHRTSRAPTRPAASM